MAQLKQAADGLRGQIDAVVSSTRSDVTTAIEARKTELLGGAFYSKATPEAQQRVVERIDSTVARVGNESQVALILQTGATFDAGDYPALLDLLITSLQDPRGDAKPVKQTVSIKTIPVPGVSGVLEDEDDLAPYLAALRSALVQTLKEGKRISL